MKGERTTSVAVLILGAALAGICFGAAGGTELTRTTVVEVLTVLAGGAVVAAALVFGRRGPLYGATTLVCFALLALVTALSITWAIVPELAYVEAGRTLAYLAVFAAGIAGARLAAHAGPAVLKGILLAATAAVLYALLARVWPASLAELEISNRIGQPFQYWNAVGTTAALAIPGLLWLGSQRLGGLWGRALAYPGVGVAVLAILLTQSRGALVAAALGVIAWLAIVPLRLRTLPVILLPTAGAAAVGAWALSKGAFSATAPGLAAKESVASEFGLLLFALAAGLLAAGVAVNLVLDRGLVPGHLRNRAGVAAVAAAGVIALLALGSVALSDRGLAGTVEDRVDELTSETDTAPTATGAARFGAVSSTRGKYWKEARLVYEDRTSVGTGAGTFRVARLRHRTDASVTGHAHGFVAQTLADLGLVGLAVTTLLLLAWLAAAGRTLALYPRRLPWRRGTDAELPRRDWTGERFALAALALTTIVFGLQSAIDWTWFVPGPAAMALVAAGFVAGRGPLGAGKIVGVPYPRVDRSPPRLIAAAGVMLAALLAAWAIWQPEAGDRATGDAVVLLDQGDFEAALVKADDARAADPLNAEPLLVRASIETEADREADARVTLEDAVLEFPGSSETWYQLA
ncbi:MAG: O-antigen ligase family protein, partial [Actinomycetota bacterium]|nr:O-antigen ligase family protein [Actinomycetota bacterium]